MRVDPVTAAPKSPPLGGFQESGGHARSPDGRLLALGNGFDAPRRLEIIDVGGEVVIGLGGRGPVRRSRGQTNVGSWQTATLTASNASHAP